MVRYIDADKLEKEINSEKAMSFYDLLDKIHFAPTEDVRPVVRGKWIDESLGDMMCVCSICGQKITKGYFSHNFCPNCGADMKEV